MWKQIEGASNYFVSEKGEVKSIAKGKERILKPYKSTNRCYMVNIYYDDGSHRFRTVHRLVAEAFIPNPKKLPQINHKDENRANNSISNLEWCDGKYNSNYGTGHARQTMACSKPVIQYTPDKTFVAIYPSLIEAERQTGIRNSSISRVCQHKCVTTGGYIWEYAE